MRERKTEKNKTASSKWTKQSSVKEIHEIAVDRVAWDSGEMTMICRDAENFVFAKIKMHMDIQMCQAYSKKDRKRKTHTHTAICKYIMYFMNACTRALSA